jgi:C4-type Zn-finger protein
MGSNLNLENMLGLPKTIECPTCKEKLDTYFNDHDIECGTNYENGCWSISMWCDECCTKFIYEFQIKIERLNVDKI